MKLIMIKFSKQDKVLQSMQIGYHLVTTLYLHVDTDLILSMLPIAKHCMTIRQLFSPFRPRRPR